MRDVAAMTIIPIAPSAQAHDEHIFKVRDWILLKINYHESTGKPFGREEFEH